MLYFKINEYFSKDGLKSIEGVAKIDYKDLSVSEQKKLLTDEVGMVQIEPYEYRNDKLSVVVSGITEEKLNIRMKVRDYIQMTCDENWNHGVYKGTAKLAKTGTVPFIEIVKNN